MSIRRMVSVVLAVGALTLLLPYHRRFALAQQVVWWVASGRTEVNRRIDLLVEKQLADEKQRHPLEICPQELKELMAQPPQIFHPLPQLQNTYAQAPVRYQTCAVVGSSGKLGLHSMGNKIDAHDAVIRFNTAPVQNYERFIGSRTDIRICTDYNDFCCGHGDESLVIAKLQSLSVTGGRKTHQMDVQKFTKCIKARALTDQRTQYLATTGQFIDYVQGFVGPGGLPSTGLFGAILATSICARITLFGFDSPDEMQARFEAEAAGRASSVPYHYYKVSDIKESVMSREKAQKVMGSGNPRHGFALNTHKFAREAFVIHSLIPACIHHAAVA
jgi:hypothetical protein